MPTSVIWQTQVVTILAKLSIWRCDWSWKTACHIDRHPGIYGETIGFLFPGLRFRTGSRRREKKAEERIATEYLDGALADFSGYIAADELYDGPFCILSREKKIFQSVTRGLYNLRNLRSIMDQLYRLFDRRCRTETALEKLSKLRRRVRRFKTLGQTLKKLFTPNIEKALTFLDDSLLPSISNAVERGYRRHRKMQKNVYRVRTQDHISQRVAIDMQREEQSQGRLQTTQILHNVRNGIVCSR